MSAQAKTITLKTADDQVFEVPENVAMEFDTVKSFFDDNADAAPDTAVPLPNISGSQLSKIITYCKKNLEYKGRGEAAKEESENYDKEFLKEQNNEALKELILAANYLNVKDLLDMLNQEAADRIKNRSVEYVRKFFGIESDFTPEEEQRIRNENAWAFEGVDPDTSDEDDE